MGVVVDSVVVVVAVVVVAVVVVAFFVAFPSFVVAVAFAEPGIERE